MPQLPIQWYRTTGLRGATARIGRTVLLDTSGRGGLDETGNDRRDRERTALVVALLVHSSGRQSDDGRDRSNPRFMSAVEWKNGERCQGHIRPVPQVAASSHSRKPECDLKGDTTKWAVETYGSTLRRSSHTPAARRDQRVRRERREATSSFEAKSFTITRGVVTTADLGVISKPGIYRLLCITHPPAHQMDLVVMPKP
jgi:hypothetical protein